MKNTTMVVEVRDGRIVSCSTNDPCGLVIMVVDYDCCPIPSIATAAHPNVQIYELAPLPDVDRVQRIATLHTKNILSGMAGRVTVH